MSEFQSQPPPQQKPGEERTAADAYPIHFYIEDPAGERFRAEALNTTLVRDVAADFFEERGWGARDHRGRPRQAVVERIDPDNPERTQRVPGDQTLHDAGVRDDDTLRVLPESVAGAVNPHERLRALIVDQREVMALVAEDPQHIQVTTNADHAPTLYTVTFRYPSFIPGPHTDETNRVELTNEHQVEIVLPGDYPLVAPRVHWLTPIYHPNISQASGYVCLGVLADRYLPGVGLAYIVRMLADIVRYRNYDLNPALNTDAAVWASSEEGQRAILAIGGTPKEQPLRDLLEQARQAVRTATRQRIRFERANRFAEDE